MNPPKSLPQSPGSGMPDPGDARDKRIPRIRSEDLFGDAEEVLIEHNGRVYYLRKGPHGGLVLTA